MYLNKKSALLAAGVLAAFIQASSTAEAGTRLSLGDRKGAPGNSIATPIEVASDEGLVALQLDLEYNASNATFDGIQATDYPADHIARHAEVSAGTERLLIYSPTNAALTDGVVANARFDLTASHDSSLNAFTLSKVRFITSSGAQLNVAFAPFVRMTAPNLGFSASELGEVSLGAVAFETVGAVTKVEFRIGGRTIATDTSSPYSAHWLVSSLGETMLTAVAFDSEGETSQSPPSSITISSLQWVEDWRATVFSPSQRQDPAIASLFADPDGDSVLNLLELAFGLDPLSPDTGGLPKGELEIGADGKQRLALYFQKPIALSQFSYVVEISRDLINWSGGESEITTVSQGVANDLENFKALTVDPVDESSDETLFIRLRVEATPSS